MMVASGATTCSGRHPRWLATFALVLIMLGAVASQALGSPLRQLARSTTSFASDGGRYAAWQVTPASPIVVLDTLDDHEREMKMPGCMLADAERTEATEVTEVTDGGGRFLLSCLKEPGDGCFVADIDSLLRCGEKPLAEEPTESEVAAQEQVQRLLDVQTETSIPLPESNTWTRVGTRYLEARGPGQCSPPARYCVRVAFFDIATGVVSNRLLRYAEPTYELERADLDRSGAPQERVCRTLRHAMLTPLKYGILGEQLAYSRGVFAHISYGYRNVLVERCNGHSTFLPGPSESAGPYVRRSEPRSFNLSEGLLTWDTAHNAGGAEMNEQSNAHGTLSSYRLSTGRRQTWKLPPLPLLGAPNIDGSGPEVESPGVYGYSTHTANTVFWIATRTVRGAAVTSGLIVEISSVYAASVKSVAVPARAQPASSQKICAVHKCRTLAADSQVRVFQATARHPGRESYRSTFAKWLPSGRDITLGGEGGFGESSVQGRPAVSGRFVAYAVIVVPGRGPGTGFGEDVVRLDVQTASGRSSPADGGDGVGFVSGSPGVTGVVATPAGSVAWMIEGGAPFPGGESSPGSKAILVLSAGATTSIVVAYSLMSYCT